MKAAGMKIKKNAAVSAIKEFAPIAVIGMACHMPDASDYRKFWQNLRAGVSSAVRFSDEDLENSGICPDDFSEGKTFIRHGCILDDATVENFDYAFFHYSRSEAEVLDPQQRLFLRCALEALEDAGHEGDAHLARVGVYGGSRTSTYLYGFSGNPYLASGTGKGFQALVGNDKDYLATRVAYKLNLHGPAVVVQSACSTSMLAVHLGCEALHRDECDMALCGGVSIMAPQRMGFHYQPGMILSPEGLCRPFDAKASGTVFGNGAGIVVLKRLEDALRDGDHVRAVIKASAVNNDGSAKAGYTAPSFQGQCEVIRSALAQADFSPAGVGLVEAHGTGTPLGDPIEFAALAACYPHEGRKVPCAVGSVKSNIGHLDAAAGVASLLKAILAVQHGELPPTVNFDSLNPQISLKHNSFRISEKLCPWPKGLSPRRAGISSFGIGGTNVHMYVEEAPKTASRVEQKRSTHIFAVSGEDRQALARNLAGAEAALADFCAGVKEGVIPSEAKLADICFSSTAGRRHYKVRRAFAAPTVESLLQKLRTAITDATGMTLGEKPFLVFPGGDGQPSAVSAVLYETLPIFREAVEKCAKVIAEITGAPLTGQSFLSGSAGARQPLPSAAASAFVQGYALASALVQLGITPGCLVGAGTGHYAAAAIAGIFALEDAVALMAEHEKFRCAPHSPAMSKDVAEDAAGVKKLLARIKPGKPRIPVQPAVTCPTSETDMSKHEYWLGVIRNEAITEHILARALEGGVSKNGLVLTMGDAESASEAELCAWPEHRHIALLNGLDDWSCMASGLAALHEAGADVRWDIFYAQTGYRRVPLPTYALAPLKVWREDLRHLPSGTAAWKALCQAETKAVLPEESRMYSLAQQLQKLAADCLLAGLSSALPPHDGVLPPEQLTMPGGVIPQRITLLKGILECLTGVGSVQKIGDSYAFSPALDRECLRQSACMFAESFPECRALAELALRSAEMLPGVLTGRAGGGDLLAAAAEVWSAQGNSAASPETALSELLASTPFFTFYNRQLEDAFTALAEALPSGAAVRVLELNALSGRGIWHLARCENLPANVSLYAAESTSRRVTLLQGMLPGTVGTVQLALGAIRPADYEAYDIVIAANTLHGACDAKAALAAALSVLKPGGLLIFREITDCAPLHVLLFGLLWPEREDMSLRPVHPYLAGDLWKKAALGAGCDRSRILFENITANAWLKECWLAARKSAGEGSKAFRQEGTADAALDVTPLSLPLLAGVIDSPVPTYGLRISPHAPVWLRDHKIYNRIVVPATCYLECMAELAALEGNCSFVLENVSLMHPLSFTEDMRHAPHCRMVTRSEGPTGTHRDCMEVQICSRVEGEGWKTHVVGTILPDEAAIPSGESMAALQKRICTPLNIETFFKGFTSRGMRYGSAFLGVHSIFTLQGEALSAIRLPSGAGRPEGYVMHPALLDACLQTLAATVPADDSAASLPVGIDRMNCTGPFPEEVWCHASLRERALKDGLVGDLTVYANDGTPLCTISGLHMRRVEQERLEGASAFSVPLYNLQWQEAMLPETEAEWSRLVWGDESAAAAQDMEASVRDALEKNERRLFLVLPEVKKTSGKQSRGVLLVLARLLRMLGQEQWHGVLGIATAGRPMPEAMAVTAFAQAAASEFPGMHVSVALTDRAEDSLAKAAAAMSSLPVEPLYLVKAGNVYVRRMTAQALSPLEDETEWTPRLGTCCIVAGGTSGMGLEIACRLAVCKTGPVVIMGRNLPVEAVQKRLDALCAEGAEIRFVMADVADRESLDSAMASLGALPPVSLLVHAAGISDDCLLKDMTDERLGATMAPKSEGAENLLRLAQALNIPDVVLFSSISSLWGTPGTAAYAAANGYLDGLAGVPGVSVINWGTFGETGLIARAHGLLEMQKKAGLRPLTTDAVFACMKRVLTARADHVVALDMDWQLFSRHQSADTPLLSELMPDRAGLKELESEPEDLRTWLRKMVASALGMDAEALEEDGNLLQLGMDSLLFLNLAQAIKSRWKTNIAAHTIFEMPTIAGLAAWIEGQIADAGTEVQPQEDSEGKPAEITPDEINRYMPFPLTDIQHAYWIGRTGALELGNIACQSYSESDVSGLDPQRYQAAWNRLIQRHDMLRARILPDGTQVILKKTPELVIPVENFSGLPEAERQEALQAVRSEMTRTTLAPENWPLLAVRLSRLDEHNWRVHLVLDLLVADVFSAMLMMRELQMLYDDPLAPLPELHLSFRDYVIAIERARDHSQEYAAAREYWLKRMEQLPPAPELPLACPPESIVRPTFSRRSMTMAAEKWATIKGRGAALNVTPAAVMLAAYGEVLAAWSASQRFTLNVTLFNRKSLHPQVNSIVGDFTSVTLLEVDARDNGSFAARASQLQRQLWQDMEHRDFSGVQLLREMARKGISRPGSAMPVIFTANFSQGNEQDSAVLSNLVYSMTQTPQVWLDNQMYEENGMLLLFWDFVEDLFPEGVIDDMFNAYVQILENLASDSDTVWTTPVSNLVPEAQQLVRTTCNITEASMRSIALHADMERQAVENGAAPAVITSGLTLTHAALWQRAAAVRNALKGLDVGNREPVAIVMTKGWEQVAAAFGILLAGGSYVPIDARFPTERRNMLLAECGARAACVAGQPVSLPENVHAVNVSVLEPLKEQPSLSRETVSPDSLAYVIYTSGSTGKPKGVMISHQSALNTLDDVNRRFGVGSKDIVLGLANLNFDLSVYDIFGLLGAGGTLVLPDVEDEKNPEAWAALIRKHGVTIWNSAPALLGMLLAYLPKDRDAELASLRRIMLSGDWVPLDTAADVLSRLSGAELYSLGGATEAAIWSVLYPVQHIDPAWQSIPYGRAMTNQSIQVMDGRLRPCPDHVTGQIVIGGAGLAMGYHNNPEKTAQSFITHPITGERLYLTGDMGRYTPDGVITFLGRKDQQVKILGHRIELGEIEAALLRDAQIRRAVVTAPAAVNGQRRLVAYWQGDGDSESIRAQAAAVLPDYMLPEIFIKLEQFPLSPSGKIDRKALPQPDSTPFAHKNARTPSTADEVLMARLWGDILMAPITDATADFFESGGDSLLMIRLLSAIREATGITLQVRDVFSAPTVQAMASALAGKKQAAVTPGIVVMAEGPAEKSAAPVYLLHEGSGTVQRLADLAEALGKFCRVYGLELPQDASARQELRSLDGIVRYHAENIIASGERGPCVIVGYCAGGYVAPGLCRALRQEGLSVNAPLLVDPLPKSAVFDDPVALFRKLAAYLGIDEQLLDIEEITPQVIAAMKDGDAVPGTKGQQRYAYLAALLPEERYSLLYAAARRDAQDSGAGKEAFLATCSTIELMEKMDMAKDVLHSFDNAVCILGSHNETMLRKAGMPAQDIYWRKRFSPSCRLRFLELPADHFSMLSPPHSKDLAHLIHVGMQHLSPLPQ